MSKSELTFSATGHDYSEPLALICFSANWCGPCQQMVPIMKKLAEKYAGQLRVLKVDVDQQPELSNKFNIRAVPTLVFLSKDAELDRQMGSIAYQQISDMAEQHLANFK